MQAYNFVYGKAYTFMWQDYPVKFVISEKGSVYIQPKSFIHALHNIPPFAVDRKEENLRAKCLYHIKQKYFLSRIYTYWYNTQMHLVTADQWKYAVLNVLASNEATALYNALGKHIHSKFNSSSVQYVLIETKEDKPLEKEKVVNTTPSSSSELYSKLVVAKALGKELTEAADTFQVILEKIKKL